MSKAYLVIWIHQDGRHGAGVFSEPNPTHMRTAVMAPTPLFASGTSYQAAKSALVKKAKQYYPWLQIDER